MKRIKCFIVWMSWGHSSTATGHTAQIAQCTGCGNFVFKRHK